MRHFQPDLPCMFSDQWSYDGRISHYIGICCIIDQSIKFHGTIVCNSMTYLPRAWRFRSRLVHCGPLYDASMIVSRVRFNNAFRRETVSHHYTFMGDVVTYMEEKQSHHQGWIWSTANMPKSASWTGTPSIKGSTESMRMALLTLSMIGIM